MPDRPTIFLDSFGWVNARRRDGSWPCGRSGRVYTIMARPRAWEHGEGRVEWLTPRKEWLEAYQRGEATLEDYRQAVEALWAANGEEVLRPGALVWLGPTRNAHGPVRDGDTLCCACSAAASRAGECHRAWAAPALVRAGWRVVLDGEVQP